MSLRLGVISLIFILFIIAVGHLSLYSLGYKRGLSIKYDESVEKTVQKISVARRGNAFGYVTQQASSCLKNEK